MVIVGGMLVMREEDKAWCNIMNAVCGILTGSEKKKEKATVEIW